jgi:hypothetical protein
VSGISSYGVVIEQDYENGSPTGTPSNGVTVSCIRPLPSACFSRNARIYSSAQLRSPVLMMSPLTVEPSKSMSSVVLLALALGAGVVSAPAVAALVLPVSYFL